MGAQTARSDEIGDLILQVEDLRRRVLALETRLETRDMRLPGASPLISVPPPLIPAVAPVIDFPQGIVPVLGRMLLAVAGAYVLRALTDWGTLPPAAGVAIGLVYAFIWLWVAARSPVDAKFAAAVTCCTSVLIMAPLLWEATGRLKVMSSASSAGVLTAFALIALVLGSRHAIVATIAAASSIGMALALVFARDDIGPFTVALLVIAASMEFAAWRSPPSGARAFAAVAADFSVLLFSYLMAGPRGMPETWVQVAPTAVLAAQLALVLIYVSTSLIQTIVRRRTITFPEITQTATALLIGIGGAVWVLNENRPIMLALGVAALTGGLALYAVSFLLFERQNKQNFRALATFGLFLVLAGIYLPFSRSGFWILSCICAAACCWWARRAALPTLGLHGAAYLLLGSAAAGATGQPLRVLFGVGAGPMEWLISIAVLLTAAVCWAAVAGISAGGPAQWRNQISSMTIAAHIVWIVAGLAAYGVVAISRTFIAGPNVPADTLGTVVLAGISLTLAWAGTLWKRPELVWVLYGIMAITGYKLATRDFMNEHNLALVVSLLCYGGTLILLPRTLRTR
jgi:hypothetical protein